MVLNPRNLPYCCPILADPLPLNVDIICTWSLVWFSEISKHNIWKTQLSKVNISEKNVGKRDVRLKVLTNLLLIFIKTKVVERVTVPEL